MLFKSLATDGHRDVNQFAVKLGKEQRLEQQEPQ